MMSQWRNNVVPLLKYNNEVPIGLRYVNHQYQKYFSVMEWNCRYNGLYQDALLRDAAFFLAFISPLVKDDLHIAEHTFIVYYSFTYFIGILYPLFYVLLMLGSQNMYWQILHTFSIPVAVSSTSIAENFAFT